MEAVRIGALIALHEAYGFIIHRGLAAKYPGIADYARALNARVAGITISIAGLSEYHGIIARATFEARLVRKELVVDHMEQLTAVARFAMPTVVQKVEALQMPPQGIDAGQLLVKAEAMACALDQQLGEDMKLGVIDARSIARLREAADSYQQAIDARAQAVAMRKAAGDAIDAELGRVRGGGILGTLSGWIEGLYQNDPEALAEWTRIMARIRKDVDPTATADSVPASPDGATSVPAPEASIAPMPVAPMEDAQQQRAA